MLVILLKGNARQVFQSLNSLKNQTGGVVTLSQLRTN